MPAKSKTGCQRMIELLDEFLIAEQTRHDDETEVAIVHFQKSIEVGFRAFFASCPEEFRNRRWELYVINSTMSRVLRDNLKEIEHIISHRNRDRELSLKVN